MARRREADPNAIWMEREPSPEDAAAAEAVARVARAVFAHIESGASDDRPLWAEHYDPGFESVESCGTTHRGYEEVWSKHEAWKAAVELHEARAEGPNVSAGGFGVRFEAVISARDGRWSRRRVRELGVYEVRGGKVVREVFYGLDEAGGEP